MYVSPYITEGLKGELADVSSVNDVTLSLNSFIARPQICTVGQFVIVGSFFNSNEGDYNTARRPTDSPLYMSSQLASTAVSSSQRC